MTGVIKLFWEYEIALTVTDIMMESQEKIIMYCIFINEAYRNR